MAAPAQGQFLLNAWYQKAAWLYLLWPLSCFYRTVIALRHWLYHRGVLSSWRAPVPVVVVGNISVGGTGKTPLVIALVEALKAQGFKPGIVSRGYGSTAPHYPFLVTADSNPDQTGDEPLLLALRSGVPVMIDSQRCEAIRGLLQTHDCDVLVADDGLQHYAMQRDIEIVVIDGQRLLANKLCLPAGPLREPASRLRSVDYVVSNGRGNTGADEPNFGGELGSLTAPVSIMNLQAAGIVPLQGGAGVDGADWTLSKTVHAVAGIGNPGRFFSSLRALGFTVHEHVFADHHPYCAQDIEFGDDLPVIMTEKDAVKARVLAVTIDTESRDKYWFLKIEAELDQAFFAAIIEQLRGLPAAG